MKRSIKTEREKGREGGKRDAVAIRNKEKFWRLSEENIRKAKLGVNDDDYPLVKAYWEGWQEGYNEEKI